MKSTKLISMLTDQLEDAIALRVAFLACYQVVADNKQRERVGAVAEVVAAHLGLFHGQAFKRDLKRVLTNAGIGLGLKTVNTHNVHYYLGIKKREPTQ